MATRYTICYYFLVSFFFNIPFITANLLFFHHNLPESCISGAHLQIPLGMWLKITAYNQLMYLVGLLLASLLRLCTSEVKDCILACSTALVFFNSILQMVWLIIGGVIFWEQKVQKNCDASFKVYMYCQIIISLTAIIFILVLCRKHFLESQFKDEEENGETLNRLHEARSEISQSHHLD